VDAWNEDELYAVNMKVSAGEISDIWEIRAQLIDWWGLEDIDTENEDV
jgi:hypothetical protein